MPQDGSTSAIGLEFHVARIARDRYQFDESLFSLSGNVVFANFHAARVFAQKINQRRDLVAFPEQAIRASQINALGLIHEITHSILRTYRDQQNPRVLAEALEWLDASVGQAAVEAAMLRFVDEFPPLAVYRHELTREAYMAGQTQGMPNRQVVLEEMLMLWLANSNPAFAPFQELFDDAALEKETAYPAMMSSLYAFFSGRPVIGGVGGLGTGIDGGLPAGSDGSQNLIDILRAPARAAPHSLEAQLLFIQERWGRIVGRYVYRLFGGLDLIKEEEKPIFLGPGPVEVPSYDAATLEAEPERFTPDRDWMPRLVMIAKNAYVWLDQLSKRYQQPITTLDQIPDEELDALARRGITGLWLIGLWERSAASQRIKQIMGNQDAVASAYSLFDYVIAAKLGGEAACASLRERAWQRGIRLASDMVPNHVGIDGRWVVEHPDWFISLDYSPFPSYSFSGPDLSWDERVGIYLEDHYYDHSDAAVVFKRVDRWTGSEKYVYHGNDGTVIPWNDTAQLNYLSPEVREGVIQTILHVARQFPVIRFDAAMTLAKRHFQRLWFPEPGTGGAIPSRAEHGLTKAQFDAAIPEEFWREVVDRCAVEAPDTLLLAEAFWLMESYFVRTLGMHRVYNSAFMVLLRDEDNAKYRSLMKNTLEFDPEILKRYVNFMNNPDERTAVDQFGKGDKYFGVCTLMVTMPGLPMFGHGQIEGFTEKYGMEYQRAYWDEAPNEWLIARHEREIFPLLHRRYLFAEVRDFLLYDFYMPDGAVNEDVFAYSNRFGDERALVIYHNRFADIRGWIRLSAAYSVKAGQGDERALVQQILGEGLALRAEADYFCIFRDQVTGLEYLRNSKELYEQGMYVELGAYKCHVFLDIREVQDNAWRQYAELAAYLDGRGVPSIDEALKELFLQPILQPFKELVNGETFRKLYDARVTKPEQMLDAALLDEIEQRTVALLLGIKAFAGAEGDEAAVAQDIRCTLEAVLMLPVLQHQFPADVTDTPAPLDSEVDDEASKKPLVAPAVQQATGLPDGTQPPTESDEAVAEKLATDDYSAAIMEIQTGLGDDLPIWSRVFGWAFVHALGKLEDMADYDEQSRSWIDEWLLGRIIARALQEVGLDETAAARAVVIIKRLTSHQHWFAAQDTAGAHETLEALLRDSEMQQLLGINRYQGVLWFNKQSFERLLWWLLLLAAVMISADAARAPSEVTEEIAACYTSTRRMRAAAAESGYQVEKLLAVAQGSVK
jgi:glycosidase